MATLPPPRPGTETRPPTRGHDRSRRALGAVAVVSALLGIGLGAVVVGRAITTPGAVPPVADAIAERPPQTVPPITTPTADTPADDDADDDADAVPPGRDVDDRMPAVVDRAVSERDLEPARRLGDGPPADLSPLADLLGPAGSAIPVEVAPRPVPAAIEIDSIDVTRFPIREVGLDVDGRLEIPDETEIGWYRYGATAGRPGATVLAAHVSWNGTTGPFFELGSVEPGDRIAVDLDDGVTRHYEVTERTMYDKDELPRERIWRTSGDEELVLITCGGDFNPELRRYRQNIVVYAVPVA